MGFGDWLLQPVIDIYQGIKNAPPLRPKLTTARGKVKVFRPETFDEYIGQEKAKDILKSYIRAVKERNKTFPHILIHGKAGCGKTTLAKIIANELGEEFVETISSEISSSYDLEWKIDEVGEDGIIFLDEIHSLSRDTCESMYSMMEDFTLDGESIEPFTLIGATTELGEILKDRRPFYDRFKIIIELEDYTELQLSAIAYQFKQNSFPDDEIANYIYDEIGKNCRGTPRTAIRLLEATIYLNGDINRVLKNFSILKDGYTEKDLKILKYIAKSKGGVGLQGLSAYLGTSAENYTYEIEPYLLKQGLIIRTPRGRKIAEDGLSKIEELDNEKQNC